VANIEAEDIECDFRWVSYLFAAINGQKEHTIAEEDAALAREFDSRRSS
jgi:hypothetical protein